MKDISELKKGEYPERVTTECPFCRDRVVAARKGSGVEWRGGLDFWYAPISLCRCRKGDHLKRDIKMLNSLFM